MKLEVGSGIDNQKDIEGVKRQTQILASALSDMLNSGLTFQDNLRCQIVTLGFVSSNTDVQIPIRLNAQPIGYLVIGKSSAFDIYNGSQNVLTKQYITVRASALGTATIMIF